MKTNKAIEIKDLVIDYGNSIAVNKINLEINQGELVTLLGPSGCGKSTTLNALAGLITSTSGKIYFEGKNVTKLPPKDRDIGLVFQSYALYPHMTVYKNIAFPLSSNEKFKKEVEVKNKKIDLEILKLKFELSAGKDFDKKIKEYTLFNEKLIELENNSDLIDSKAENATKNAKELPAQTKIRRDGRIRSSAENSLKLIQENNKKIKEIIEESKKLKSSSIETEKIEALLETNRGYISKLEKENESIFNEHSTNIECFKKEYEEEIIIAKSEKQRIISEVKVWKKEQHFIINEKVNKLKTEKMESAMACYNEIKKISNGIDKKILQENEEYLALKKQRVSWAVEADRKVREVAERVGITDQLPKKVTQLSGGQQQRVAISRTLVKSPSVLLLDEPLSNLDAKMRVQTREWIRNLQQELGITTVFVTHDQEEAMSISDKIVCMSKGLIQQVDEPMEMYHNPVNKFVAGFLGMPQMNFYDNDSEIGKELMKLTKNKNVSSFGIRPEHVKAKGEASANEVHKATFDVEVSLVESFGRERLASGTYKGETIKFFTLDTKVERGTKVKISFKKNKIYMFDNTKFEQTIGKV